jgi:hypothetical protein
MDLKGTRQKTGDKQLRQRSGAFPYELAYRLISMFSVMGDTVLDPFLGTGTTLFAAVAAGRNSLGYEIDQAFQPLVAQGVVQAIEQGRRRIGERFDEHLEFVSDRQRAGKVIKYTNQVYGFPVITRQEIELMIPLPTAEKERTQNQFRVTYTMPEASATEKSAAVPTTSQPKVTGQLFLFD